MKKEKIPGPDGFTVEFYKRVLAGTIIIVLRAITSALKIGTVLNTRTEGNIILIPKGNKPRKYIKNWRPISLLNVSYKLASTSIANRVICYPI